MRTLKISIFLFISVLLACSDNKDEVSKELCSYVDPFIGTGGHGHTYPGACLPFGMVQLSPDTRLDGWDGCSGYHYSDSIIYGFSHTHLSGTGCSDYGDILFMPATGSIEINNGENGYPSEFSHKNESASPGYYSVLLDKYNIQAELTVTERCGFHKYTFPENNQSKIVVDLQHRDEVIDSYIDIISDTEIEGYRRSRAWAEDQYVYFYAKFSKPFKTYSILQNDSFLTAAITFPGKNIKSVFNFETEENEEITVKTGISGVSCDGAKKNLEKEIGEKSFDEIMTGAKEKWEKELGKIKISEGIEDQMKIFYTALYHSMLAPNIYEDVDKQYRGTDLKIHKTTGFTNYTVFSLWDTYRAAHPLYTIIERKRDLDFINSFLAQYKNGGQLPVWELSGNETGCMIGYHSVPVIVDARVKGIRGFDEKLALEAMLSAADKDHLGLKFYKENGYIPAGEEGESVSKTLEYCYDDWCIAQFAKETENKAVYDRFIKRAQFYKNIFDPSTGFMRAKNNEAWFSPFDPYEVNFNYTEANSWQYSFSVPHDILSLIDLHGGKEKFSAKLDELFTADQNTSGREQADITGLIGQYAHGNEPSHHIAYLYSFAGQPWKTQKYVRQILNEQYFAKPDGLSGNEDCGQMSAWFVLSSLGFYPVTPGSPEYILGSPLFPKAEINLESGNQFIIIAENISEKNIYVKSVKLNGKAYTKQYITHQEIMNGGELIFTMTDVPDTKIKLNDDDLPFYKIAEQPFTVNPFIDKGDRVFKKSTTVEIKTLDKNAEIFYTIDGSDPDEKSTRFSTPVKINKTTQIKAISVVNGVKSAVICSDFSKMPENMSIELLTKYENQYAAGGNDALIDCLRGGSDFKTGRWQGYEGVNVEAIVDLGSVKGFKKLGMGFLQDQNSWIFMPEQVDFYFGIDKSELIKAGTVTNDILPEIEGIIIKEFYLYKHNKARYIKIVAKNRKTCPERHKGAGNPAWIFTDEIIIE